MTGRLLVLDQMLALRRRSTLWWMIGMAAMVLTILAAYPSAHDSAAGLESYMDSLPEGLVELFGASAGIGTPEGYLNSQMYANLFPILVLVLGVGAASWAIAGAEAEGTLEMLLANPVSRRRVAVERLLGVVLLTGLLVLVATLVAAVLAPAFELSSLPGGALWAAGLAVWTLALVFSALAFGLGAATGSKAVAIGAGAGAAAGTYVLYGITAFISSLEFLHWISPWYWFLDADPLHGVTGAFWLQAVLLPLAVATVCCLAGIARLDNRDLG
jgi:ABC-2 type transport system permease protein